MLMDRGHLVLHDGRVLFVREGGTVPPGWWRQRTRRIASRFGHVVLPKSSLVEEIRAGWYGGEIAPKGAELRQVYLGSRRQAERWLRGLAVKKR